MSADFIDDQFIQDKAAFKKQFNEQEDNKARLLEEEEARKKQEAEAKDVSIADELGTALTGGVKDTISSAVTLPERVQDMFNGEMQAAQAKGEDYEPEFNPLGGDNNKMNKTWWGKAIRGVVHFGTMAGAVVLGAKGIAAAGIGGGISAGAGWLAGAGSTGFAANAARGAAVGAAGDLLSEYSQDANALGELRDHFGLIDTPLSTKDTDHPLIKTLKNVVEGMGIGVVADGVVRAIGRSRVDSSTKVDAKPDRTALQQADAVVGMSRAKAEDATKAAVEKLLRQKTAQYLNNKGIDFKKLSPEDQIEQMLATKKRNRTGAYDIWNPVENADQRAARKVEERNKSVEDQTVEKGRVEMADPEFRGHKNKPIADAHQGSPNSMGSPYDIHKQAERIHKEYGAEAGSTDNIITPAAAERYANEGYGTKEINLEVAKELFGEARLQRLLADLRSKRKSFEETFGSAYEKMQVVTGGRDAGELTPEQYWKPIMDDVPAMTGGKDNIVTWSMENVVAADLVNVSLFKKLRDLSIGSRELIKLVDITDVDGPVKSIRDNLIVGLTETKRARYTISQEFRSLAAQNPALAKKTADEVAAAAHESSKAQVDMMLDLARQAPRDDFLHAVLEAFSMSNDILNWTDFDAFMRRRLKGETTASGVKKTGQLIRELQGVMINSVLSGPKTPLRAIMGTSTAVFTRPMAQMVGGLAQFVGNGFSDASALRTALASANAMVQTIPEAAKYFKTRTQAYWSGELSNIKSRYAEYSPADEQWELMTHWAETRGTAGDKAAFRITNVARMLNNVNFLTYSSKLMAATDDAFTMILARARAKEKAMNAAFEAQSAGIIPDITPQMIKEVEAREYAEIFDAVDGSVSDDMLKYMKQEATLTKDVTGFGKSMDALFDSQPLLKPFYLFARTGINGLEFSFKHVPGLNLFVKEFNDIWAAKPGQLDNVRQYGITNDLELANAKALQNGRLAVGSAVTFMASQAYLNGNLSGNGPADIGLRRVWEAAGWKPRSIKLGDVWVSYDSMEPFSNLFAMIGDLGDNQRLMGDEWVEKGLVGTSLIMAKGLVSKTYLQGLQQVFDLFGNDPKKFEKIAASLMNNTVPMSSLRNEIGRAINPGMRELSSSWTDQIRNRNLTSEFLAQEELPYKYDILTGKIINDWHPLTRMFNMISPIQLNLDPSPGRQLLLRSNYDMRMSVYSAPDGTNLSDSPKVRSLFQKAIGEQGLEDKLAKIATEPRVIESLKEMEQDIQSGRRRKDPMSYHHNERLAYVINRARARAWGSLRQDADVIRLVSARKKEAGAKYLQSQDPERSNALYDQAQELLKRPR